MELVAQALILFRFPTNRPQITPEIKALKEIRKNIKFCIDNYQIVTNLQALTQKFKKLKTLLTWLVKMENTLSMIQRII